MQQLYTTMVRIRQFEEKIVELYPEQEIRCPVHLCIGQEAIAAGVSIHLNKEDYVFSTHRSHGHFIGKGSDIQRLMAECYGKRTGYCKGKGGSMHLADPENGLPGTTAIVGGGIPLAVGTALASSMKGDSAVSVTFFGDGAAEQGTFHESLNFASLKGLPVIFVCENNYYATNSPLSARQPHPHIAERAQVYGIPGREFNGNDVLEVFEAAAEAIDRARSGNGPSLIVGNTYRWKGHVGPEYDYEKGLRPREELLPWMERCPIKVFKQFLMDENILSELDVARIHRTIDEELEAAVAFAKESPFPEASELFDDVFD